MRDIPILVMAVTATPELTARARNAGAGGGLSYRLDPVRLVAAAGMVAAS
ncbi:hypothetical protein [Paracoccus sp. SSJ]|nr:hypothetical protein [Paracoccus sp. SSJ]